MLSLYAFGGTLLRIDYDSKEACLSAGSYYMSAELAERFDCGFNCRSFERNNLLDSPICEPLCNEAGCL